MKTPSEKLTYLQMSTGESDKHSYIARLTAIVEANLADENFGVSELAQEIGVSRSRLYIKIKSLTQKSVSQFIREIRLNKAQEMLKQTSLNVSEIAYRVGFRSPTYFNSCFHKLYGYPPGEAKKQKYINSDAESHDKPILNMVKSWTIKFHRPVLSIFILILLFGSYLIYTNFFQKNSRATLNQENEKSILILPFQNLTPEKNNQYFADGISADIINQLTKISDIRVFSRIPEEQLYKSSPSFSEIPYHMNFSYILKGSVRKQGNDVRISVQLVDAKHDRILWSENYDRQLVDIFAIQSDIARNVANLMQSILSPEKIEQVDKLYPKNTEAYDSYLMGRYLWDKRDSASLVRSLKYFEKAIEIDSSYTLAYAGLADSYYALSFTGNIERNSGYNMAYKMAEKALKIDNNIPEAYAVLGIVNYFGYWNWEEARKMLETALEVDSNCMVAHLYYCSFLDIIGESDVALKHAEKANELEPYFYLPYLMKGIILRNDKKYEESTDAFRKSQELSKAFWCDNDIFYNFLELNDEASAVQMLREILSIRPEFEKYSDQVTPIYEKSGITGIVEFYINAIQKEGQNPPYLLAALYTKLGMQEEALGYLEKACREKERDIPRIICRPEYEDLHNNPRFLALVDTMNLAPYFKIHSE